MGTVRRNAARPAGGFTLVEVAVALVILAVGGLFVTRALVSSESAAQADANKARAVRSGSTCLRILGQELSQSSTEVDPSLPPEERQRLWPEPNGVRFQKVVGHATGADGALLPRWSPMITYTLNPATGDLWRNQVGEPSRRMARGVARFEVAFVPGGAVTVTLECRHGAGNRGTGARHSQTVRFLPRNRLR